MHSLLMNGEIAHVEVFFKHTAHIPHTRSYTYAPVYSHDCSSHTHPHTHTHPHHPSYTSLSHPHSPPHHTLATPHSRILLCGAGDAVKSMKLMEPVALTTTWTWRIPSSTAWDTRQRQGGQARAALSVCSCVCVRLVGLST